MRQGGHEFAQQRFVCTSFELQTGTFRGQDPRMQETCML